MAINHTETSTWTIEDLVIALNDAPSKKNKIIIPKFQRTLVWKKDQKKAFVDSVKKGFPVGAILLYKSGPDNSGNILYNLIDGLQRSTSLNQYIKAPTQFFDETNLKSDLIDDLFELTKNSATKFDKDTLCKEITTWIVNLKGFEEINGFSSFNLSKFLNESLGLNLDIAKISDLTKDSAILFFKYLYTYSLTAYEEISSREYDIEHLVPVDKLKEIAGDIGIPMSAFPNLCLLESSINRKKLNLTYYQYYKAQVSKGELTNEQAEIEVKNLEAYTHTIEADLLFVENNFTADKYKEFLNNRFKKLTELFFEYNSIQ